jgi:hypothetical protein
MKRRAKRGDPRDLRLLSRLAAHVEADDLRAHFVVGAPPPVVPSGWSTYSLGAWTIAVEPGLPIAVAVDEAGAQIGWLLGHALDLELVAPVANAVLGRRAGDGDSFRPAVQRWIDRHAGRYLLVLPGAGLVAPDSLATVSAVFDRERSVISSSPFLLQRFDEPIPDDELADVFRIESTSLYFLFTATPHARGERMLPNHILDLTTWQQIREWPTGPYERGTQDELVERIAVTIERTIAAAAVNDELNQSMTAGGDTRVMLACSRPVLDRIHCFTVAQPDPVGRMDAIVAARLASRFGFDHRVLPWTHWTRDDVRRFMIRTGALDGEYRGSRAGPTYALLGAERPYVSGVHERTSLGWRPDDNRSMELDGADLLRRYDTPQHPRLVAAADRWLAELPGLDAVDALTLLGTELRFGLWGGALTTAYPDACTYTLYPFAHRSILDAELRMEFAMRRYGKYRDDLIRSRWPELLDVGINAEPARVRISRRIGESRNEARNALAATPVGIVVRWAKRTLGMT